MSELWLRIALLVTVLVFAALIFVIAWCLVTLIYWIRKRQQMRDPKSLTYAVETGDWSNWSGTELGLAYVMNPYIGDIRIQSAIGQELDRRGIRR